MRRLLFAALLALSTTSALAETLIHNANGIQVGADGKLQRFKALLIGDDGKVVQTFTKVQNPHAPKAARVDAGGRTLLPGLIDAHGHVIDAPGGDMGLGLLMLRLDVGGTSSIADLQARLADYARSNPGSGWIVGRGWNQELWQNKRYPTAADLDAAVADRPVLLSRVDGHAAVANSAALKAANITAATRDPSDGRIERDSSGRPTGLLIENAIQMVADRIPPPTSETMTRALQTAQESLLSNGITAVADMGSSPASWAAMNDLAAKGGLNIRIISYADGLIAEKAAFARAPTQWLYGDRLRLVGYKLYADGALGSRGAWLKAPYADMPNSTGVPYLSDAQMLAQSDRAASKGFQVAIHAIGDAANAQAIGTFEALSRRHGRDRRWRVEHVQVVDPADIARIGRAGIIASMQPVHQTSDRTMAEARLDPPRLQGAYAWNSVARNGARLAFGSDFPVESPNPFPGLAAATSRQDPNGVPPGGWRPEERVSLETALAGFTRNAAYAGFAEDRIGSLERGKWADFILLDRDVSAVDPQSLAATQVLETWVAGKKVWQRPATVGAERGK